jgi:squalene-associated FAD-dependent desaturase
MALNSGRAVVIGAGLAGLETARLLRSAGFRVTLVESRPRVGGRAFSFRDPATGLTLDNGQHVILGCCTRFQQWAAELGLSDGVAVQPRLALPVVGANGTAMLQSWPGWGPLHLAAGLSRYRHLSRGGRFAALRAGLALARPDAPPDLTFARWLQRLGHRDEDIARLWNLLTVSVFNADAVELSAKAAVRGFRQGFIGPPAYAALGLFRVPLGRFPERARQMLVEEDGIDVRLAQPVNRLLLEDDRVVGVRLGSGEALTADVVVATVQPRELQRLVQRSIPGHPWTERLEVFRPNPILNGYFLFDRPVMDVPVLACVDSPLQFVFNRGALVDGEDLAGKLVAVSLSAARQWVGQQPDQLIGTLHRALAEALPAVQAAHLLHVRLVWQMDATVVLTPKAARRRAQPQTPWPGFYLAGDWTDTDWPCSMESALLSADRAVAAVTAG